MGTGHLNASRAFTQFQPGEHDSDGAQIPTIGWDYGTTTGVDDMNRYQFAQQLLVDTFISITLAWDRVVEFAVDNGTPNVFDGGDEFEDHSDPPFQQADSVINDLSLLLVNRDTNLVVAQAILNEGTVEHLFFQIPETADYDFLVKQEDNDVGNNQDYAVAWWAVSELPAPPNGDFDGDNDVDGDDLTQWLGDFGINNESDANNDGDSDGHDFLVWQRTLSASVPGGAIPEPGTLVLALVGLSVFKRRNLQAS